jgi:ABC-2 type transport system permease protein
MRAEELSLPHLTEDSSSVIRGHLRAIRGAFIAHWRLTSTSVETLAWLLFSLPLVAIAAWTTRESGDPAILAFVAVGAALIAVWNGTVFQVGWSLAGERFEGTLDFQIMSRTPSMLIMVGKAVAIAGFGTVSGVIAFVTAMLVAQEAPDVASVPLLLVSLCFTMLALITASFIFAPSMMLFRGRSGIFNLFQPLVVVLSGFLYPIELLPAGFEIAAKFVPTSWAMASVIRSIEDGSLSWRLLGDWAMVLLLTAVFFAFAWWMFRKIEMKLRVTGDLSGE